MKNPFTTKRLVANSLAPHGKAFWWTSALAVLVTIGSLVALNEWYGKKQLIEAEQRSGSHLVRAVGNILWPAHGEWLKAAHKLPIEQLKRSPSQAQIMETLRSAVHELPVLKVNVFDPATGITLFSTNQNQVGESEHDSPGLNQARKGIASGELQFETKIDSLIGPLVDRTVVSTYLPYFPGNQSRKGLKPAVIVEIYADVTEHLQAHRVNQMSMVAGVIASLSLMYAVVFVFGRHNSKTLAAAQRHRERQELKIRHQAFHDSLTGLPNRAGFDSLIARATKRASARPVSILFVDLDRFKLVNDSLGHKAGDQVLQVMAERIRRVIRDEDRLYRVGGDEFVVLLDARDQVASHLLGQRIISVLSRAVDIDGSPVTLGASVGIAHYPADDVSFEQVVRCADMAMYAAKRAGANQLAFYVPQMKIDLDQQAHLLTDVKRAIDNNEFVLHYQPRLCSGRHTVESVEALIRWEHPELGLLYPDRFIRAVEDSPLILDLGAWVLDTACKQAMQWEKISGQAIGISVNVAAKQFRHSAFVKQVKNALTNSGLPANRLELELTEGQLITDLGGAAATLVNLKSLGVTVAIDDFGTGYSSLAYLHKLPIDCLKIDRAFVKDLETDPVQAKIAHTIALLAHNLGLKVVAEGVETLAQAEILTDWGCEQLQGFYFSKAVPAQQIILVVEKFAAMYDFEKIKDNQAKPASLKSVPQSPQSQALDHLILSANESIAA
jgi:diguanylate cyclase (GGDEF)-like protein